MKNILNYSKFVTEALNIVETKITLDDMQFAYVAYTMFDVSVEQALEISLN